MLNKSSTRLLPIAREIAQKRFQSVVSGPPTQHVSKAEKILLGGGMVASLLVIPAWVVYHIREYRGGKA